MNFFEMFLRASVASGNIVKLINNVFSWGVSGPNLEKKELNRGREIFDVLFCK